MGPPCLQTSIASSPSPQFWHCNPSSSTEASDIRLGGETFKNWCGIDSHNSIQISLGSNYHSRLQFWGTKHNPVPICQWDRFNGAVVGASVNGDLCPKTSLKSPLCSVMGVLCSTFELLVSDLENPIRNLWGTSLNTSARMKTSQGRLVQARWATLRFHQFPTSSYSLLQLEGKPVHRKSQPMDGVSQPSDVLGW